MPSPPFPRQTLFPALALAGTFAVAFLLAEGPGRGPKAHLHRAVLAYHRALFDGREEAVHASLAPESPAEAVEGSRRIEDRRGKPWLIQELELTGPNEARVRVALFVSSGHDAAVVEEEQWRQAPDGAWRLLDYSASGRVLAPRGRR